ncbi:Nocturnin [Aphanomyces cochlioides]|nr:Nocturnin [Aphanomyces cochlioides]
MWVTLPKRSFSSSSFSMLPTLVRRAAHPSAPSTFSIAQLNILASNLASPDRFPYVQPELLEWETRKNILMRQLADLRADVICLEECSDYWTFFRPSFLALGYDSVYVKRPSTHSSTWSGDKKMDGCGIFFRQDKFELKECDSVNFRDEHDRVALLALLKEVGTKHHILVGSTHLWWNSNKVDHQMRQLVELNDEMIQFTAALEAKYAHQLPHGTIPVVLCGDFNNSPTSPLYHYMEKDFLSPTIAMKSAYADYRAIDGTAETGEPPHTTVNYRRCWTIDYIWYSPQHLQRDAILEIASEAELRSEAGPPGWHAVANIPDDGINRNGIPNSVHGSDHVPIMATFSFR